MAVSCLRRGGVKLASIADSWSRCSFSSRTSSFLGKDIKNAQPEVLVDEQEKGINYSTRMHMSPLFAGSTSGRKPPSDGYAIELVDDDAWNVSAGLAQAWRQNCRTLEEEKLGESIHERVDDVVSVQGYEPDFDELDNMRIRGNLFYKLDRDSKEFEEYNFDFHRKKSPMRKEDPKETKKNVNSGRVSVTEDAKLPKVTKLKSLTALLHETPVQSDVKEKRVPTFNQLTAPYHQPFCLDIYISKASVRACVVHRVTSKVVVVAHSISKDMKFDLGSTRNAAACAAVGEVLAQRALADDIHDVVYTPRKGDVLEGKLKVVLQSIVDNGVNVKVKLKQRKQKKATDRLAGRE